MQNDFKTHFEDLEEGEYYIEEVLATLPANLWNDIQSRELIRKMMVKTWLRAIKYQKLKKQKDGNN